MSYEITITKTEVQEVESGGDWTVVGEELAKPPEGIIFSGDDVDNLKLKNIWDYTPKITKSEIVTTEIYRQVVKELELPEVIRAINMMD